MVQQQLLRRQLGSLAISHGLDKVPSNQALLEYKTMGELSRLETRRDREEHRLDSYRHQAQELALTSPDLIDPGVAALTADQRTVAAPADQSRRERSAGMAGQ